MLKTRWLMGLSAAVGIGVLSVIGMNGEPAARGAAATKPAVVAPAGYKLVWADEFDVDGLPDPKKWGYEEGYVRNGESQFYTTARKENARVENGVLILECRKDSYKIPKDAPNADGKTVATYTSASIHTLGKASWQYGRMEVRAKLPHGQGVWPAIWMMGDNIPKVGWPACGELDIMEFVGHTPDKIHGTLHWRIAGEHKSAGASTKADKPWEDIHVYAAEWSPEKVDLYYDQTKYNTVDLKKTDDSGDNSFHKPFYMILNFALGGNWGGKVDDAVLPARFEVDYVRVFQKIEK